MPNSTHNFCSFPTRSKALAGKVVRLLWSRFLVVETSTEAQNHEYREKTIRQLPSVLTAAGVLSY